MKIVDQIRLELSQVNSASTRKINDEEIYHFVNKAIGRFIMDKIRKRENTEFEYDVIDATAIQPFLKGYTQSKSDVELVLPTDFSMFVSVEVTKSDDLTIPIRVISNSRYNVVKNLPYWGSNRITWIARYLDKKITVNPHKKQDKIKSITIVYIKEFKELSLNNEVLEVANTYINSIVDMAVLIGKELLGDPTWQLKERDNQKNITIS